VIWHQHLELHLRSAFCRAKEWSAAGEGVTAEAAGKPLLPPNGFLLPSRTAQVKQQRYWEVPSLLSTQNKREPAEQKACCLIQLFFPHCTVFFSQSKFQLGNVSSHFVRLQTMVRVGFG